MNIKKERIKLLHEEILSTKLDCGLRAYIIPKRGWHRKIAILSAKYGSVDLKFKVSKNGDFISTPAGIAHFLEHQLFKKQEGDALAAFGKFGASSNAATDHTSTTYYFTCSDNFKESLELLLNFVYSPYFQEQNVEKEKLIIEQELSMYNDVPDYRCYRNLIEILYKEHPVRIDIGGSKESIGQITKDMLEDCYNIFYKPQNMILLFAGDLDNYKVFEQSNKILGKSKMTAGGEILRSNISEPEGVIKDSISENMLVSRPRILIGYKEPIPAKGEKESLMQEITTGIVLELLFGKGSRFYARAYESGLIDDSFSHYYTCEKSFAYCIIGGETDNPQKLREEVSRAVDNIKKVSANRDIAVAKRKRLGKFIRIFESPDSAAFFVAECIQKSVDPFSIYDLIKQVHRSVLIERAEKLFNPQNCAVSVVSPKSA